MRSTSWSAISRRWNRGPWPADELAAHLDHALQHARWFPDAGGAQRVQVTGVLELRGLTPRHTWLGGLCRGSFPPPRAPSFLLPRALARELDPVHRLAEARYLLCSLLRNALGDDRMHTVVLSRPLTREGRPVAPAPVFAQLLDLPTADGTLLGARVVERYRGEHEPLAHSDALHLAARDAAWTGLLRPHAAAMADTHREVATARRAPVPGAWDGVLERPPPPREPTSVTALETYLQCPARYWYRYVLRLEAPEVWDPELAATDRGTALHTILERFVVERGYAPIEGEQLDAAAAELHRIATEVFAELDRRGGAEPALLAHARRDWLSGLTDAEPGPKGVLRVWLEQEVAASSGLEPEEVEWSFTDLPMGPLTLRGTIDRLDRLIDGSRLVIDYKTGNAPRKRKVERGLVLQPVAYAAAVADRAQGQPVASTYYQLKKPTDVRRTSWVGDADLIEQLVEGPALRHTIRLTPRQFQRYVDHAGEAARRLTEGRFHTTLAEPAEVHCSHCDFARICRYDATRTLAADADVQRPIEVDR